MEYDEDKVDEMVLALLHLTTFKEGMGIRAWKGHDWKRYGSPLQERVHFRSAEHSKVRENDGVRSPEGARVFPRTLRSESVV